MKEPNVKIEGNGKILMQKGAKFFMYGQNGEQISGGVEIHNAEGGEIHTNDLNIIDNAKIYNKGLISSNKINMGIKKIENWASKYPWWFAFIFLILGFIIDIFRDYWIS